MRLIVVDQIDVVNTGPGTCLLARTGGHGSQGGMLDGNASACNSHHAVDVEEGGLIDGMPRHLLPEFFRWLKMAEYSNRNALIVAELESGRYDWSEIARRTDSSLTNTTAWWSGVESLIDGIVTSPSQAVKQARLPKWVLNAPVSDELRAYLRAFLARLAAINPDIKIDTPSRPGTLRSREG